MIEIACGDSEKMKKRKWKEKALKKKQFSLEQPIILYSKALRKFKKASLRTKQKINLKFLK